MRWVLNPSQCMRPMKRAYEWRVNVTQVKHADGSAVRVTDASIPPSNEFPGGSGYSLFLGDYTGLAIGSDGNAHPAWADTRNPIYTFDLTGDPRVLVPAGYGADTYTRRLPA